MNIRKQFVATLVCILGTCLITIAADHTSDSLETVKKMIAEKKAVLIDVREQDEWDYGHLQDAVHLPTSKINKGVTAEELSKIAGKDTVIYLHCKVGKRSADAAKKLKSTGRDLRALKPGYFALIDAGFAPAKSK